MASSEFLCRIAPTQTIEAIEDNYTQRLSVIDTRFTMLFGKNGANAKAATWLDELGRICAEQTEIASDHEDANADLLKIKFRLATEISNYLEPMKSAADNLDAQHKALDGLYQYEDFRR